jgi:hypothetical protein
MAKNLTIEEAEAALERARQFEAEQRAAERAEAERRAQLEHDKVMSKQIDELERDADAAIANAAKTAKTQPVSRGAAANARGFLVGELTGTPMKSRIVLATEGDPAAASLLAVFEHVVACHNRMTVNRRREMRSIGPELGQRLTDLERHLWGQLIKRLRELAGEKE